MLAVMTTILLGALDQTIVGVAVPAIARQLGGFEWMAWVISGYLVASTVVTPLYGRFSDLFGRRSMMALAIAIFLVASVACALAQSLPQLVLARVVQGIGGGGVLSMAQAVIADIVPLRERGRYQSYISIVWAVASMLGPVIGGILTDYLSWPWIFWINLPVGGAALALVWVTLAGLDPPRGRPRIDVAGSLLLVAGLTALLLPITRVGQGVAWSEPANLAGWALAALLLAAFGWQERRHPAPIVPLGLLRLRAVVVGCVLLFICFFIFIALSVLVPLRLQLAAGLPTAQAALQLLPLTLSIPAAAFASGRWIQRFGRVRGLQRAGVAVVPAGLAAMAMLPPTGPAAMAALVLLGIGMGLQMPTTLITVQQSVPRALIGTATAMAAFFRLLGGAVGIAVLSSVTLLLLRAHLPASAQGLGLENLSAAAPGVALAGADLAFRQLLWISAGVSLIATACAIGLPEVRLHDAAQRQADSDA